MPVFIAVTRTLPAFPRYYRTWRQELDPPFRRCDSAYVLRLPWLHWALVAGRWHSRARDVDAAIEGLGVTMMAIDDLEQDARERVLNHRAYTEAESEAETVEAAR